MYRLFLGAPPSSAVDSNATYHWQTVPSTSVGLQRTLTYSRFFDSFVLPPATLDAASRRISLIYQNAIFDKSTEEEDALPEDTDVKTSDQVRGDQTTLISWPPTEPQEITRTESFAGPSFLLTGDASASSSASGHRDATDLFDSTRFGTQETQSYNYSDASSIARFPTFHFNIHSLIPLADIPRRVATGQMTRSVKTNVLLAVLELEGPDTITIKKGADAGKEVAILKLILGDEASNVCKLTAWREVAEEWGGIGEGVGMKRGDIVHLENVLLTHEPSMSPTITASPNLRSKLTICYRTMPYTHEDGSLRPDLRLGDSDPCVRKVAAIVRWFEGMAGLPSTN